MAPKKHAKKPEKDKQSHKSGKDARRAFEHLSRVEAIARHMEPEDGEIRLLLTWAEAAYGSGAYKSAAELLRATEHFIFGSLTGEQAVQLPENLAVEVQRELQRLREHIEERTAKLEGKDEIARVAARALRNVSAAEKRKQWHRALELARGAEALTHVEGFKQKSLNHGRKQRQLTA